MLGEVGTKHTGEAIASRLEAIEIRLEAIACELLKAWTLSGWHKSASLATVCTVVYTPEAEDTGKFKK